MSTYPRLHSIEFGEGVLWTPPAGAATFFVWHKQAPDDSAPRWAQARGYNIATHAPIVIPDQVTALALGGGGVTGSWQTLISLFDGYDPEVVLVTAQDAAGKLISSDRYALPTPNSAPTPPPSQRKSGSFSKPCLCSVRGSPRSVGTRR